MQAMRVFEKLIALRAYQKRYLPFLTTLEDMDIVRQIGYHQEEGHPITFKGLLLENIGPAATIHRQLDRLKQLGVVLQRQAGHDKRALELRLSDRIRQIYRRKEQLLGSS